MTSLAILARAPEKGRVKTRLQNVYSQDQCLSIYTAMLRDALENVSGLRGAFHRLSVYWASDAVPSPPPDLAREFPLIEHFTQRGDDLGARMFHCMADEFERGSDRVVLIGCDCPHLPEGRLLKAAEMLESADVVLGPSEDGGYYLIGATRLIREPFEGIQWSTPDVLRRTLEILEALKLKVAMLPLSYDLDRPEDLERLWDTGRSLPAKNLLRVLGEIFRSTDK
jgi:hypothetical protein